MNIDDIIQLGDPRLYQVCKPVEEEELKQVNIQAMEMAQLILKVRKRYGFGRGIAAPQLGVLSRFFVLNIDSPEVFINPELEYKSDKRIILWDDCMSFPKLLVQLKRHESIKINYRDHQWKLKRLTAKGTLSELIQHEIDHLEGVLSINRAISASSFRRLK